MNRLIEDYQSSGAVPDTLLTSLYVDRREDSRDLPAPVLAFSLKQLQQGLLGVETKAFSAQLSTLCATVLEGVGRIGNGEFFRLVRESTPSDAPMRIVIESLGQEQRLAAVLSRSLGQTGLEELAHKLAKQAEAPLGACLELVAEAKVGAELGSALEKIARDYLNGRTPLEKAQPEFQRNAAAVQDPQSRACLLAAEKLLFVGTVKKRNEGLQDWVDLSIHQTKALTILTHNTLEGLGSYHCGLATREARASRLRPRAHSGSPAALLVKCSRSAKSLLGVAYSAEFLQSALAKKVGEQDAEFAKDLLERLSSAYAGMTSGAAADLVRRAAGRLIDIDATQTLTKVAKTAKRILAHSFDARGKLGTRRSNLDLLERLDSVPQARHRAVPLSTDRQDCKEREKAYFGELLKDLERLFPERDLVYTLSCLMVYGEVPSQKEGSWTASIGSFLSTLCRSQITEMLSDKFSEAIDSMTCDISINKGVLAFVMDGLKPGPSRQDFLEKLAELPNDDSPETLYRRARLATLYVPCVMNGTEDGFQHKLLAYTFVQFHHLMQYRPFAKNLIFWILDDLREILEHVTMPSKGDLGEQESLGAIPLKAAVGDADEDALGCCVDLLAYLFTHGSAEMGEAEGWLNWKSWAASALGATAETDTVKAQLAPELEKTFGSLWPLRTPQLLASAFASLASSLEDEPSRMAMTKRLRALLVDPEDKSE